MDIPRFGMSQNILTISIAESAEDMKEENPPTEIKNPSNRHGPCICLFSKVSKFDSYLAHRNDVTFFGTLVSDGQMWPVGHGQYDACLHVDL
jgi:hypothetical protein